MVSAIGIGGGGMAFLGGDDPWTRVSGLGVAIISVVVWIVAMLLFLAKVGC